MANIPIAKISVEPIEVPIDKLLEMLRPYVICRNCKFFTKDSVQTTCFNPNPIIESIEDSNGEEFSPPEEFGCMFWKMCE
jgi:hypothetical protein